MSKIKRIQKTAIILAIILLIPISILVLRTPYINHQYARHLKESEVHIAMLTKYYQAYLDSLAQGITSLNMDPIFLKKMESKYLSERQQPSHIEKYLWMSKTNGQFVFGIPEAVFSKMNEKYDQYEPIIKSDNHFYDRNDYLTKLIDRHKIINFKEFEMEKEPEHNGYQWRFNTGSLTDKENWYSYYRPSSLVFTSTINNSEGQLIGTLFLKIDDIPNKKLYYNKNRLYEDDIPEVLMPFIIIPIICLWFLLPTWVFIDGQQRNMKNPLLWAILSLISLFFGLIVYLIVRPATIQAHNCPQCEKELNGTKAYCPYCGFDVSTVYCQQCQYPLKPDWLFCPSCRAELKHKYSKKQ